VSRYPLGVRPPPLALGPDGRGPVGRVRPVLLLLALTLAVAQTACEDAPAEAADAPPPTAVRVERVRAEPITPTLRVPGIVEADARIELAFRVTGFIERFHADEGDRVAAGDVLAELDAGDLEREVRAARAALARVRAKAVEAERAFARARELSERDTGSREAHDRAASEHAMAQAELAEARVRLETAEDRLAKATLRAPVDGLVEARLAEPHEVASERTPVLVLTQLDRVTVRASVPDAHFGTLRVGAPVRVHSPTRPAPLEAAIRRVGVAADADTRTVPFEVELANAEGSLIPELVVEVEIPLGETSPQILVPLGAVLRDAETRPFCFAVADGERGPAAERRPVRIGAVHGNRVAVLEGLAPGDRIVVRGQHFLRPGRPLRVVDGGDAADTAQTPEPTAAASADGAAAPADTPDADDAPDAAAPDAG